MIEEKKILVNQINTNYKITGQGEPILILHGWGGSSDSWQKVQEVLAIQGYKVIVPDLPGFGKSDYPRFPWTLDDYVQWLNDFTSALDFNVFFLLAHSFGGRIAIRFALKQRSKIKKLILCSSAGIKENPDFKTKVIIFLAKLGKKIFSWKILASFEGIFRKSFHRILCHRDYIKASPVMKATMKNILAEDLAGNLSSIKNETLIVWGEDDKMVPVKNAYFFKEKIGNSQLEVLKGVKHGIHLAEPEKLSEIILKFLHS